MAVTVISYPDNEINYSFTTSATDEAGEKIKYLYVDVSEATTDEYIEVVYNGETITYYITDEHKYTPLDVFFINKEGSQQTLCFFKERKDSFKVTSSEYESNTGQPLSGYHQNKRYNVQAKSSFKVNSGWIEESNNESFKQLLLSEKVWILENDILVPVNVSTTQFTYKTQLNDKLISYEIEFDYAFNEINNI